MTFASCGRFNSGDSEEGINGRVPKGPMVGSAVFAITDCWFAKTAGAPWTCFKGTLCPQAAGSHL